MKAAGYVACLTGSAIDEEVQGVIAVGTSVIIIRIKLLASSQSRQVVKLAQSRHPSTAQESQLKPLMNSSKVLLQ